MKFFSTLTIATKSSQDKHYNRDHEKLGHNT